MRHDFAAVMLAGCAGSDRTAPEDQEAGAVVFESRAGTPDPPETLNIRFPTEFPPAA